MSSTSSVCDCDDLYGYRLGMQEPWCDYYHTIGQPLIYYAEVQPSFRRNRSGVRKGSPNFFVKAFRWYTQEHSPQRGDQEKQGTTPDFSNFANWLDNRYGQFIQEGQQFNQTTDNEPHRRRRLFATMKNHFKKQQNVKGKIDVSKNANIKSVCSDTLDNKKSAMKSISMTSSRLYEVDYQKSIEIVVTEGDGNGKAEEKCSCTKNDIITIYESKQHANDVSNKQLPCEYRDVECQCVADSVVKVDAHTQYDKDLKTVTPPRMPVIENLPLQEVKTQTNGSNYHCNSCCTPAKTNVKSRKPSRTTSISCQCSVENVQTSHPNVGSKYVTYQGTPPVNVPTQEPLPVVNLSMPPQGRPLAYGTIQIIPTKKPAKVSDVSCSCSIEEVPPQTVNVPPQTANECTCTRSFQDAIKAIYQQNIFMVGKICQELPAASPPPTTQTIPTIPPAPCTHFVAPAKSRLNETVQTSSHSILLEDEVTKYPFFMKIVRADKLDVIC